MKRSSTKATSHKKERMMELEYKIEAEDGSGVYTMDMNDDEVRAMVDLGVQFAIVCGAAGVKPHGHHVRSTRKGSGAPR